MSGVAACGSRAVQPWRVRMFCVALVLALAVPAGIAIGPFVALYRIKDAVDRHDAAALAGLVDFPTLQARVRARLAPVPSPTPVGAVGGFAALTAIVRGRVLDFAVERLVTPAMLGRVLYGRRVWQAVGATPIAAPDAQTALDAWSRVRFAFRGRTEFAVWLRDDAGAESCLVLVRDGLAWRIGDVVV